ncbi:hypothetical protein FAI40_04040 [Acetobacteraceae bacterium]|nr:hypothetical protein FAI40_04040 [Acetobacteraceae bacterium]
MTVLRFSTFLLLCTVFVSPALVHAEEMPASQNAPNNAASSAVLPPQPAPSKMAVPPTPTPAPAPKMAPYVSPNATVSTATTGTGNITPTGSAPISDASVPRNQTIEVSGQSDVAPQERDVLPPNAPPPTDKKVSPRSPTAESWHSAIKQTGEAFKSTWEDGRDATKDGWDKTSGATKKGWDKTADTSKDIGHTVGHASKDVWHSVKDLFS